MNQFTSVHDVNDLPALLQRMEQYKAQPLRDQHIGLGKRMGLLFLNPSLRTRLSTEIAARQLGMDVIVFNAQQDGWAMEFGDGVVMNGSTVEHVKDAAPVLGQYLDILGVRSFPGLTDREADYAERILNAFIQYSGIPVVSLESATRHPLQSLTDLFTIKEHTRQLFRKPKVVLTWAPHIKPIPHCVANSFAEWMIASGEVDLVIAHPEPCALHPSFTQGATLVHRQEEALMDADVVYVKNWSTFEPYGKVVTGYDDWMITPEKLALTKQAGVMHCLPVRRNVELPDSVLDGSQSWVTQQAANRVWAAQAVIAEILQRQACSAIPIQQVITQ